MGVANTIEKIMRDFLWSGASDTNWDHLVSWEVCCFPKKEEVWVLAIWCLKTFPWQLNGYGIFL